MSRGEYKLEAANPMFSDGASGIQQKAITYPDAQQNDNDLALVPQAPQRSAEEGAVANVPKKLVLERKRVREATCLQTAITGAGEAGVMGAYVQGEIVQESVTERLEFERTADGDITIRQEVSASERRIIAAIENPCLSAIESPEDAAEEEPTIADRCIDQCCQPCACKCTCSRSLLQKDKIMTPTLRRGRGEGWKMFLHFAFPLVTNAIRDIWVTTEYIFTIIAMVLSIIMFTNGNKTTFNIVHLVLASVSFVLATLDFGFNLYDRSKECYRDCRGVETEIEKNGTSSEGGAKENNGECVRYCKNTLDFLRTWIAELILYPLLICDMLDFITGQGWKNETAIDRLGFVLFIVLSGALAVQVYIIRLLILFGMIYRVQESRKSKKSEDGDYQISASAARFQLYFYIHVCGQIVVQIFMLIGIGAKIQFDNPPPNITDILANNTAGNDTSIPIHISPQLWYMIVVGYILPFLGLVSFFIVTYYWVQEFPIGYLLDVVTNGNFLTPELTWIKRHLAVLQEDFEDMRDKSWFIVKFAYPFKSPVIVVLCIGYFFLHDGFAASAVSTNEVEINEFGVEVPRYDYLNDGNWDAFYRVAVIVGIIANLYTFLVAFVWLTIISILIQLLMFILIIIFIYFVVYGYVLNYCR